MKTQHTRTVQIVTFSVTCDLCGAALAMAGRKALHNAGWTLSEQQDRCPDCNHGLEQEAARKKIDEALAAYVAALEADAVPLIRGRICTE